MLNEFAPKSPVLLSTTLSLIHYVLYTMAFFKFLREKFLRALALALYLPSGFFFFFEQVIYRKASSCHCGLNSYVMSTQSPFTTGQREHPLCSPFIKDYVLQRRLFSLKIFKPLNISVCIKKCSMHS